MTNAINSLREEAQKYAEDAQAAAEAYADAAAEAAKAEAIDEAERLAQEALDAAKTYADNAAAEAAAKAKSEVLAEIQEDLEKTLADAKSYTDEQISSLKNELNQKITELSSRIEGIASDLNTLKETVEAQGEQINDLLAMDSKLDERLKALESYKTTVEDFIESTTAELKDLSDRLAALDTKHDEDIAALREEIDAYVADLQEQIDTINNTILEIQGTIGEINEKIADLYDEVAATNSALASYKEEVSKMLSTLRSELEAAISAGDNAVKEELIAKLDEQISALRTELTEYFNTELDALESQFNASMEEVKADLKAKYDELKSDIAELDAKIDRIESEIRQYINDAILGLEGKIGERLTSISLIPEVYVDGVPAFELPTIIYTPLSVGKDETVAPNRAFEDQAVPRMDAVVRYHLSPAHVTENGIATAEYLIESAKMVTKAAQDNDIIDIRGYEVNSDNELEVTVRRLNGDSFYSHDVADSQNYEFYTAALSLGIADELLMEGETEAKVVSEYSAIYEAPYEIHIAPLKDESRDIVEYECAKFDTVYTEAMSNTKNVAAIVDFDGELDLLTMVTSCAHELGIKTGGVEVDKEEMADLGLGFRFAIPTEPYKVGAESTDQQAFIKFKEGSETVVISTVPGDYINNEAAIGRTPIVRVELIDLNNGEKIVDVQYIKIRWAKQAVPATDLGELPVDFNYILGCTGFSGSLNWKEINQYVLARLGRNDAGEVTGISHKEFEDYYHQADDKNITWEAVDNSFEETETDITFNWDIDPNTNPTTSVLTWNMTIEQVGNVIDECIENGSVQKQIKVTINPKSGQEDYAGAITFILTLNITVEDLPTVYGFAEQFWQVNGQLAQIQPVGYSDKSNTNPGTVEFVRYNYEFLKLFNKDDRNSLVTNMVANSEQKAKYTEAGYEMDSHWACRAWDIQFSATQPEGVNYAPAFATMVETDYATDQNGHYLRRDGQAVSSTWFDAPDPWYTSNPGMFNLVIPERNSIKDFEGSTGLLNPKNVSEEDRVDVAVDIWARINKLNYYKVHGFEIWFVEPVTLPAPTINGQLEDINMNPTSVTVRNPFGPTDRLTDFQGESINDQKKIDYYGIYGPTWDQSGAAAILVDITEIVTEDGYTNITVDPNLDPNDPADRARMKTAEECDFLVEWDGNKLTVTNDTGAELTKTCHLWIKANYGHAYADYEVWVPVAYVPNTSK